MKIPDICMKSASFDREDAGWYVPNSVSVRDIVPEWRLPGGGVVAEYLTNLSTAFDNAITYTKQRIADAEQHLKLLEKAKKELDI